MTPPTKTLGISYFDKQNSKLISKWEVDGDKNTKSVSENAARWGSEYECYSKEPKAEKCCRGNGEKGGPP